MAEESGSSRSGIARELLIGIVGVGLGGWVLTRILDGLAAEYQWPWWAYAVGVGIVFVVAASVLSVTRRSWRRVTWERVGRFAMWLTALRLLTAGQRDKLRSDGYETRSDEIRSEREMVPQPAWRIQPRDGREEQDVYWLMNAGYAVRDVTLEVDPAFFRVEGEVAFPGQFGSDVPGGSTGKWFRAWPTERALSERSKFVVSWVDRAGDTRSRDIWLEPADVREATERTSQRAYERGIAEGVRRASASTTRGSKPLPAPAPRWRVYQPDEHDDPREFFLRNAVARSTAREVRVEARWGLEILDAAHWADLSGESVGTFRAAVTPDGLTFGAQVSVAWFDEEGERQSALVSFAVADDH